eukprot:scaffold35127_cov69-Phaeocystis_antarctica.AAC.3
MVKSGKSEGRLGQGRQVLYLADPGDAALRHACHRSCHTSTRATRSVSMDGEVRQEPRAAAPRAAWRSAVRGKVGLAKVG